MADRYWVGGTAAWDGTAGTKWATTSGGAGGASVPTTADAVFFDAASTGTCTISAGNTGAQSINCTGFTGTLTHSAAITVAGSVTLVAGMTFNASANPFTFTGTGTLITAGKTFSRIDISGAGITFGLGDALTVFGSTNTLTNPFIIVTQGTFNTNNYNITCNETNGSAGFFGSGSLTRTINLGSSTITSASSRPVDFTTTTNLTFNAGTSTISGSNLAITFRGGGVTFYNVAFTNTSAQTHDVLGANTFNNLTVTAPSTAGVRQVTFAANQTFNGALGTTGTAGNRRVWFRSETYGIARTLTCNAAASLTDADFRDLYVVGTAAPISGTRIGDLRGIRGITASTPKTVYWNLAAGGNWSATAWAASSGGAVSTDNHPLAQDTAIIENTGLNTSANVTLDSAVPYLGTLNMSTRTNAMGLAATISYAIYGNWVNGSGTTISGTAAQTFSGRNTQTITSAGKTTTFPITIDTYGGSVELADALTISNFLVTVTNGGFDTKNFNLTAAGIASSNSNVRSITLGSSNVTLTITGTFVDFSTTTNLTFNSGTSTITATGANAAKTFNGGGLTFYNVDFGATANSGTVTHVCNGVNTFNNLSFDGQGTAAGISGATISANQTVNGTLLIRAGGGAAATWRFFLRSNTLGTPRTLTVATLTATDADFRDITIAGAAAGSSPTRAGDCGGNTGITFPSPKTVYWNLAGTQNWSATGWAPSSGGSPAVNNFPLAQDTAVFDNTGAAGTVTIDQAWNIGTVDFSARTSAMTFSAGTVDAAIHGDWKWGTGVTSSSTTGTLTFRKRGTQTITSNGVQFGCNVTTDSISGTTQVADAVSLASTRTLRLITGTLDAVTYNVTTGFFISALSAVRTLKMGSGTWTISGTGTTVWTMSSTNNTLYKGTANIVLSDTSTNPRVFDSTNFSYNKLTIGGATGTSTLTFIGNNQFTELASTKTVAHTIALGTTTQTLGRWTVSGTAGNVVTVSGTGTISIVGSRVSGVDYLALGTTVISATSPGEFYAGANSTGGTNAILTAAPAAVTRYWVGGTGTWNATSTTNWSASSGGPGGASVPTSADAVVFDAASNATGYTVTCTATQLRCGSLTIAGPASGNVTWAGTAPLAIHGNVTLPATGLTRTYTGGITLTSNSTGLTFTTNGVALASGITVNGVDCSWSLGSALNIGISNGVSVVNGSFSLATYNLTAAAIASDTANSRTINLGTGTTTLDGSGPINLGTTETNRANLTFTASTSQLNLGSGATYTFAGNNQTFYNVSFTNVSAHSITLSGTNSYNNLSFTGVTSAAGFKTIILAANQTVTGTLTCSAGADATMRHFIRSDTLGTTRTITAAAASLTDVDFRDITIAGAAAPASGTRIGDCKGNSGITFTAAANKYWNLAAGGNWGGAIAWATSSGGTPAINNFPLAQDTAFIENTGLNASATVTINIGYNVGTLNMSGRTTAMTLATGGSSFAIYGNWINGAGTTLTGTAQLIFAGRSSQTITSAGKSFPGSININTPTGSVTLQDALTLSSAAAQTLSVTSGTFDAGGYNVTASGVTTDFSTTRTVAIGSGTWTLSQASDAWNAATSTNLTVTGTGTITLTSASAKFFSGGGVAYTNITLNQGGAGQLTISGNNTFKDITNSYKGTGAATIALAATTQRVSQWTGAGEATRLLTLSGSSAASPATLILTGATKPNVDYLSISNVRAYSLDTTWYAGTNSTNGGSLGWYFESGVTNINVSVLETATGADVVSALPVFSASITETGLGTDSFAALASLVSAVVESSTGTDAVAAGFLIARQVAETAAATDAVNAVQTVLGVVADAATAAEIVSAFAEFRSTLADTASAAEQISAVSGLLSAITEAATAADVFIAAATVNMAVDEAAAGADTVSNLATLNPAIAEAANATVNFGAGAVVYASVSMTVTIADAVVARFLWEPVDDIQSPNWQTITNTQGSGWTLIPNTQAGTWTPVQTN